MRLAFHEAIERHKDRLRSAKPEEIPAIRKEFSRWHDGLTEEERDEMIPYWESGRKRIENLLEECRGLLAELQSIQDEEEQEKRGDLRKASA